MCIVVSDFDFLCFPTSPGPFELSIVLVASDLFPFLISPSSFTLGVVASRSDPFCFLFENVLKTDDVLGRSMAKPR